MLLILEAPREIKQYSKIQFFISCCQWVVFKTKEAGSQSHIRHISWKKHP